MFTVAPGRWGQAYTSAARFAVGATVSHAYSSGYQRRARVCISDRRGGEAEGFVDFFGYVNAAPFLTQVTALPIDGQPRRMKFESDAQDFDLCTFAWSFGDGEGSLAEAPQHQYEHSGSFTVTLTVRDGELESTVSTVVIVGLPPLPSPQPPTAPLPPKPSPRPQRPLASPPSPRPQRPLASPSMPPPVMPGCPAPPRMCVVPVGQLDLRCTCRFKCVADCPEPIGAYLRCA